MQKLQNGVNILALLSGAAGVFLFLNDKLPLLSLCVMMLYLSALIVYFFFPWRFRSWKHSANADRENLLKTLRFAHSVFLIYIIGSLLGCLLIDSARSGLPVILEKETAETLNGEAVSTVLKSAVIEVTAANVHPASQVESYAAVIEGDKIRLLPFRLMVTRVLWPFRVVSWFIGGLFILVVAFFIGLRIAELVGTQLRKS